MDKLNLYLAEGVQTWWVLAEKKEDVKNIVFEYERNFCSSVEKILEDLRGLEVKRVELEGNTLTLSAKNMENEIDLTQVNTPKVVGW